MRVFAKFNATGEDVCPVCKTKEEKETVLVGIEGTEEGHNIKASQIHLDCVELLIRDLNPTQKIIYQVIDK